MRSVECEFDHAAYALFSGAEYCVGNSNAMKSLQGRSGYYVKIAMLRQILATTPNHHRIAIPAPAPPSSSLLVSGWGVLRGCWVRVRG
eukprot:460055-Rhodomonas_salina.1